MEIPAKYIFLVFCFPILAHSFRCDYEHYPEAEGWFKLHTEPLTWSDAISRCSNEGAALAVPSTYSNTNALQAVMNKTDYVSLIWTDLALVLYPGKFFDYAENDEAYVMNKYITLEKKQKSEKFPFICYINKDSEFYTACGNDSTYILGKGMDKCYKFHRMRKPWRKARNVCLHEGGNLAVIQNEDEAQTIRDIFAMNPSETIPGKFWNDSAFLGFRARRRHRTWVTVKGQPLAETGGKWAPGEPNNAGGNEFCGSVGRNGLLYDDSCELELPYICEKQREKMSCVGTSPDDSLTGINDTV